MKACASALIAAELPERPLLEAVRERAALVEHADGIDSLALLRVRVTAMKHMPKVRAAVVAANLGTRAHADVRAAV